eukprot:scaffold28089_cov135-Isochrysis_galbana.AAC.2
MTEILLKKSEDESSDVCAGVRVWQDERETRRRTMTQEARCKTQAETRYMTSSQWVPCSKNAVNESTVNGRKTCKRHSKELGRGSRITRTLTKDRRDTINLDI